MIDVFKSIHERALWTMSRPIFRQLTWKRFVICFLVLVLVINEFIVYLVYSWRWPMITPRSGDEELVVMLISDPQLQGFQDEPAFPLGTIRRWDSDRYMHKTFDLAYSYVKPDVIVFLGDLIDEGSKATDDEYEVYVSRFHSIYSSARGTQKIYLPGDNDIGGEGGDRRTLKKMDRYEKYFGKAFRVENMAFVDFIKLDIGLYNFLKQDTFKHAQSLEAQLTAPMRVLLNHGNVLTNSKMTVYPLLKQIRPNLIISGHTHFASHHMCNDCLSAASKPDDSRWSVRSESLHGLSHSVFVSLQNTHQLSEFVIPTCSYRMGVKNMGIAVAQIKINGEMTFNILWSPGRYPIIHSYWIILSLLIFAQFIRFILCHTNLVKVKR